MSDGRSRQFALLLRTLLALGLALNISIVRAGQPVTMVVDAFHPEGTRGSSYSDGQIGSVWSNWFGSAFQSLSWDAASDADGNAGSGSMNILANFPGSGSNQFTVINGFNGINPSISARQFTALECDVRFAPGSATYVRNGTATFGYVEFGMATPNYGQLYFGGAYIPASQTGWVHITVPLDPATNANLLKINNVMVHLWGGTSHVGPSTLWVDNLKFTGTTLTNSNGAWYFTYRRPANRPDISCEIEISADLNAEPWTTAGVTHQRLSTGEMETWQGSCTPAAGRSCLFFRLHVSQP